MANIAPNATGISVTSLIQNQSTDLQRRRNALEKAIASDGGGDYLYTRTKDPRGMLGSKRQLDENQAYEFNNTKNINRSQTKRQFIDTCQRIALDLGVKISRVRTDGGTPDHTFGDWCRQQLHNIARSANTIAADGTYACASGTLTTPPIDVQKITSPLPPGAAASTDYAHGAFNSVDIHISSFASVIDAVDVTHPGIEKLVRTLRMCLSGNVNDSKDVTWSASIDLLNREAVPDLSDALSEVGECEQAIREGKEMMELNNEQLSDQFQNSAMETMAKMFQDKMEIAAQIDIQRSNLFTNLKDFQKFLEKMEQLS